MGTALGGRQGGRQVASKSQKKKERHNQRRKEKRKHLEDVNRRERELDRKAAPVTGANARHQGRILQQKPAAWSGELDEDVAVFQDEVLARLTPEMAAQAKIIREALQEATQSRGEDALKRVSVIPRGSRFSEWRLFIRGLVEWLSNDSAAASDTWSRLDFERRPGRIATSLMVSLRTDLERLSPPAEQESSEGGQPAPASASGWDRFDEQQLYHARLVRRIRFDRAALKVASVALRLPEESTELTLGPRKIDWIKSFIAEYKNTEPDLVAAVSRVALLRAYGQNYGDLFEEVTKALPGPAHDPRNRLLSFFFELKYPSRTSRADAQRQIETYLTVDLPQNPNISEPLRAALTSLIHLQQAFLEMRPRQLSGRFERIMYGRTQDATTIRKHLLAAATAAPQHEAVYQAHRNWIEEMLDDGAGRSRAEIERLEHERVELMDRWVKGVPESVEPRLWLVDYFLDQEETKAARPHIDFLSASRQDDPRVRALPWKWLLLEAMRLSRRKTWLEDIPGLLDEAAAAWPTWLSRQWLPYLRSAVLLRRKRQSEYEQARRGDCEASGLLYHGLLDACMALGAAQLMHIPAAELKPLRAVVDTELRAVKNLTIEDLIALGSFFWDLTRSTLDVPAIRKTLKPIGTALVSKLVANRRLVQQKIQETPVQNAILWASESLWWNYHTPTGIRELLNDLMAQNHPVGFAATVNSALKERWLDDDRLYSQAVRHLRAIAPQQADAYNRYWFASLADDFDQAIKENRIMCFGVFRDSDDEDEDDEDDF